MKTLVLV